MTRQPTTKNRPAALGVVLGRFQVVHNDHVKAWRAARELCRHLIIAIADPDPAHWRKAAGDFHAANPFTYFERTRVVRSVLKEMEWDPWDVSLVPFPFHRPELHTYYVPRDALFFLGIHDRSDEEQLEHLRRAGLRTHLLWRKPAGRRVPRTEEILRRMGAGEPWEHLVPRAAALSLKKMGLLDRIAD